MHKDGKKSVWKLVRLTSIFSQQIMKVTCIKNQKVIFLPFYKVTGLHVFGIISCLNNLPAINCVSDSLLKDTAA